MLISKTYVYEKNTIKYFTKGMVDKIPIMLPDSKKYNHSFMIKRNKLVFSNFIETCSLIYFQKLSEWKIIRF